MRSMYATRDVFGERNKNATALMGWTVGSIAVLTQGPREVERAATGGAGSGEYKPISNQDSAPNAFEGAGQRHPRGRFDVSYLRPMAATIQSPACCAGSSEPVGVEKHAVSG